jgi:hypothetical protein
VGPAHSMGTSSNVTDWLPRNFHSQVLHDARGGTFRSAGVRGSCCHVIERATDPDPPLCFLFFFFSRAYVFFLLPSVFSFSRVPRLETRSMRARAYVVIWRIKIDARLPSYCSSSYHACISLPSAISLPHSAKPLN